MMQSQTPAPLTWRRASCCQNGECVEIAAAEGAVIMKSSNASSPVLHFTGEEFAEFLADARLGKYDHVGVAQHAA
jgi:Domain of unknown function (DUF397)